MDRHGIEGILAELRAKAGELREHFGCEAPARALEWAAERVETVLSRAEDAVLTLREAAAYSGYSMDHLARLVREKRIPDLRPKGSRGRIRIRVRDLPRKPLPRHTPHADVHELASRLLGGKDGRYGHP